MKNLIRETWSDDRAFAVGHRVRRSLDQRRRFARLAGVVVFVGGVAMAGTFGPRLVESVLKKQPPVAQPAPAPAPAVIEPSPTHDWQPAAHQGDFDRAFPLMKTVRDEPKELLLASDVARLSGHPDQARGYLQKLIERHPRDSRAPLAAFTLGRVQLEELGHPKEAALAFAKARGLEPDGPLAEDALAREVEAWSRAGEVDQARSAAETYLQRYPQGQRALAVRRYAGL